MFSSYHVRDTKKNSESNVRPSNSLQGLRFVSLSHAGDKAEDNFLYFFTELKTSHLSYSINKHDANDIAYPSSNHRMRVIYELRNGPCSPSSPCGSAEEHRSAKSDGL